MAESHTTQLILHRRKYISWPKCIPFWQSDSTWRLHRHYWPVDRAQFPCPLYLLPPGASPTQHACPGKAFTHEAQFAKFIVEPWAVMAGKEDSEGHRGEQREREWQKVQYQRTNFAGNLSGWFPGRWADFLDMTPPACPLLYSLWETLSRTGQTCLLWWLPRWETARQQVDLT